MSKSLIPISPCLSSRRKGRGIVCRRSAGFFVSLSFCFSVFVLSACGPSDGPFRLEGRFRNMNQAQLCIYDAERGWKDTINVRDGRLAYERTLQDTATLTLLFPNYTEIPVFAQPGAKVTVKGDASHLRETEIRGTDENDDMTEFRLHANELMPPEVVQWARRFISDKPASPVSFYLLKRYFLQTTEPDYALAFKLCDSILHATENGSVVRLHKRLENMKNGSKGSKIPPFTVKDTKGKTVTQKHLQADANVVLLWASWNATSRTMLSQLRRLQKDYPGRVAVVSVCLDASAETGKYYLERDTITWPNVCDGKMWQTPLVDKFGLATVPGTIVADKQGKIIARNLPESKDLKEKVESLLK